MIFWLWIARGLLITPRIYLPFQIPTALPTRLFRTQTPTLDPAALPLVPVRQRLTWPFQQVEITHATPDFQIIQTASTSHHTRLMGARTSLRKMDPAVLIWEVGLLVQTGKTHGVRITKSAKTPTESIWLFNTTMMILCNVYFKYTIQRGLQRQLSGCTINPFPAWRITQD